MKAYWKGVLLCVAIALPAWFLGKYIPLVGGPVFAILLGIIAGICLKEKTAVQQGITFTSKKVLQLAVVLLGFGMNLSDVFLRGRQSLPIILATITTALLVAFALHHAMKIAPKLSILVGVGSAICGGSAIAATAPVIGADDEEVAQSISVIFLFNIIAALIFPALGNAIGLTNEGFGIFAGTAINDTSSVTAAATAWDGIHGSNTLEIATIVKLTRTLAIIPITLVLALVQAKKRHSESSNISIKKVFPIFILLFVLASVITTVFALPGTITGPLKDASKFFITMAMAAIGLNTNIVKLVKTGGKAIAMGFCCWVSIASVSLLMQYVLSIL